MYEEVSGFHFGATVITPGRFDDHLNRRHVPGEVRWEFDVDT